MTLKELLESCRGRNVSFVANPGNAGDGLIHAGWAMLAGQTATSFDRFYAPEHRTGDVVFIMGAGAFCAVSWHGIETTRYYAKHFKSVYVLPSSFEFTYQPVRAFAESLPKNVVVYCREQVSFNGMKELMPSVENLRLDHDLAFQLDVSPWKKKGSGVLHAFRTDKESALRRIPRVNFDISNMGNEHNETLLLDVVSNYQKIYTDRLHVAIAGALLGKEVELFEGSYHKIRAIYEHSMKGYTNLTLRGPDAIEPLLTKESREKNVQAIRQFAHRIPFGTRFLRSMKRSLMKQKP